MTIVGERFRRTDGEPKARGEAIFGVDYLPQGTIHGVLLRSPVPSGRIVKLDVSATEQMPGVRAVVTSADMPDSLAGWVLREQPMFARDRVRYEGEPVAAVAADTLEQARQARDAIVLEIEETPAVADLDFALSDDSPLLHPDWESYVPMLGEYPRRRNIAAECISDPEGVDEAFATADRIIEDEYRVQRQYQAYIEPKAAVVIYQGGRYEVHTAHQFPFNVRDRIAQYLDIRPSQIRVIGHTIGGGFGAKLDAGIEPHACALSRAAGGLPVKIVNNRAEDMLTCPSREDAVTRIRTALDKDGNMTARELVVIAGNGAYSGEMPWLASIALHCARGVYRAGPTRVKSWLVYTNTAPTGAFRGVNGAYLYHAVERHMDHIAAELGRDRREYRLEHLFRAGEVLLNGQVLDDAGILREAFDVVEGAAPWKERLAATAGPMKGVGIGAAWWVTNPMPGTATLKLNEDGTIGVITAATDNGSGAVTLGITQIVAEKLGVQPEDVYVTMPDTDVAGFDAGSQGSRTTRIVGKAASIAADEVIGKIKQTASDLLEAAPSDIVVSDGKAYVAGSPDAGLSLADVAATATWTVGPIQGTGSFLTPFPDFNPGCATGLMFPSFPTPTYHVHLAEVEVDPVTGNVKVTRYVVAQEVGKIISPDGAYGQVSGGVTQGIGYALYESLAIGEDGRYKERNLENYRLPLAVDIPRVEFFPLEHPDPDGPFGAKGVGENSVLLGGAVIANAVADAVGAPFDQLPIKPEAVLKAIAAKREAPVA